MFLSFLIALENVLIQCSTLVLSLLLAYSLALVLELIISPECEAALEQLLAVFLYAHCVCCLLRALIIVYDLIQLLLQLKTSSIHLCKVEPLLLLLAEVAIDVQILVVGILLLEREESIQAGLGKIGLQRGQASVSVGLLQEGLLLLEAFDQVFWLDGVVVALKERKAIVETDVRDQVSVFFQLWKVYQLG